jgi:hypothetical protein
MNSFGVARPAVQQAIDHGARIGNLLTLRHALHQTVHRSKAASKLTDQRRGALRIEILRTLKQRFDGVAEIAHRRDTGDARATLEGVQCAQ